MSERAIHGTGQVIIDGRKLCTRCENWLPLADFKLYSKVCTGLSSHCFLCHKLAQRLWRAATPDYQRRYNEARRVRNPAHACPNCNAVFVPGRKDKVYCSPECKTMAHWRRASRGAPARFDFKRGRWFVEPVHACLIDTLGGV